MLLQVNLRISGEDKVYVINHSEATLLFVNETLLPLVEPTADKLKTVKGYVVITDNPMD